MRQRMGQRQTPAETSPARPRSVPRGRPQRGPLAHGLPPLLPTGLRQPRRLLQNSRARTLTTLHGKGRLCSPPTLLNYNGKLQLVSARLLPLYAQAHKDTNTRRHSHAQSHSHTYTHTLLSHSKPSANSRAKLQNHPAGFGVSPCSLLPAPPARTCRRSGSAVAVPRQGWPGPGAGPARRTELALPLWHSQTRSSGNFHPWAPFLSSSQVNQPPHSL